MQDLKMQKIVNILRGFGCKEIYLFDSYMSGTFPSHSDIDIAVKGLPPQVFFEAYGKVLSILDVDINIIDLDDNYNFTKFLIDNNELKQIS